MRRQFAGMLADARFVAPAARAGGRGGRRGDPGGGAAWADDPAAIWNKHAAQPAVVRPGGLAGSALAGAACAPSGSAAASALLPEGVVPIALAAAARQHGGGMHPTAAPRAPWNDAPAAEAPLASGRLARDESCAATSVEHGASAARDWLSSPAPPCGLLNGSLDARARAGRAGQGGAVRGAVPQRGRHGGHGRRRRAPRLERRRGGRAHPPQLRAARPGGRPVRAALPDLPREGARERPRGPA